MGKNSEILPGILYFSFLDSRRPETSNHQPKASEHPQSGTNNHQPKNDGQIKETTDANHSFRVQCQDKPEEIVELELHIQYVLPEIQSLNCKNLQLFGSASYKGANYRVEVMLTRDNPHTDYIKLYLDQPL